MLISLPITLQANPPEHVLECGHIICHECALDFGIISGERGIIVEHCPLELVPASGGGDLPDGDDVSTNISTDPVFAGLRVLSLDGYAMASISHIVS